MSQKASYYRTAADRVQWNQIVLSKMLANLRGEASPAARKFLSKLKMTQRDSHAKLDQLRRAHHNEWLDVQKQLDVQLSAFDNLLIQSPVENINANLQGAELRVC